MKKIGLILVGVVCFSLTGLAGNKQPATAKWAGNINVEKLSEYLKLNNCQSSEVSNICDFFSEQMNHATTARFDQSKKLRQAIYGNLKLMKQTLSKEQYAKYLTIMNITLSNKGIELK